MSNLGLVLGWKFDHYPGIETKNDRITSWPTDLGRKPNSSDIQEWTAEYNLIVSRREVVSDRSKQVAKDLSVDSSDIIGLLDKQMSAVVKMLRGDSTDFDNLVLSIDKAERDNPLP